MRREKKINFRRELTQGELDLLMARKPSASPADVAADIAAHEAEADPHPVYATDVEAQSYAFFVG